MNEIKIENGFLSEKNDFFQKEIKKNEEKMMKINKNIIEKFDFVLENKNLCYFNEILIKMEEKNSRIEILEKELEKNKESHEKILNKKNIEYELMRMDYQSLLLNNIKENNSDNDQTNKKRKSTNNKKNQKKKTKNLY